MGKSQTTAQKIAKQTLKENKTEIKQAAEPAAKIKPMTENSTKGKIFHRFVKHDPYTWGLVELRDGVETEIFKNTPKIVFANFRKILQDQPREAPTEDLPDTRFSEDING